MDALTKSSVVHGLNPRTRWGTALGDQVSPTPVMVPVVDLESKSRLPMAVNKKQQNNRLEPSSTYVSREVVVCAWRMWGAVLAGASKALQLGMAKWKRGQDVESSDRRVRSMPTMKRASPWFLVVGEKA